MRSRKGQAVFGEYVLLGVIAIAAITIMTVYVKRTLQGRIRDSIMSSPQTLREQISPDGGSSFISYGNYIYLQYEPYYANRTSFIEQQSDTMHSLRAGGSTGIFRADIDDAMYIQTQSTQAPSGDAD